MGWGWSVVLTYCFADDKLAQIIAPTAGNGQFKVVIEQHGIIVRRRTGQIEAIDDVRFADAQKAVRFKIFLNALERFGQ